MIAKQTNISTLILVLIFLFVQTPFYSQDSLDEGLYFYSSEVNPGQRTSLNLTPNKPFHNTDKFSLEFEANFRDEVGRPFGNIFKIIGDENLNIDMLGNLNSDDDNFWLAIKDNVLFKYKWSDIVKGDYNKWIKFNLEIDIKNSALTMTINGDKITKTCNDITGLKAFKILFGKSLYNNFSTSDVCPMSVRNIKIFDSKNILIREWTLGKHTFNNQVFDNLVNEEATAENPKWLIDQHVFWNKNKAFVFDSLLGTAKDRHNGRIFFIDKKSVNVYDYKTVKTELFPFDENTIKCQSTSFIYNRFTDELIAYSIDESTYNTFNFETSKWQNTSEDCIETAYLHHNSIISPRDSTLYTFGGYGYYTYNSSLKNFKEKFEKPVHKNLENNIFPRYLSASGLLNPDTFLIFGGYGSPSGRQGVNSQFYYDLYSVDFKDLNIKKLWEAEISELTPFVPSKSMVIDKNSETFYTLIYNNTAYDTQLKLARFGIKTNSMTVYSDSIPYKFLDIKSDTDFFLNSNKSKLYTLTTIGNKAELFSLTYPPLLASDIYQDHVPASNIFIKKYWYVIVVVILFALFVILKGKNRIKNTVKSKTKFDVNKESNQVKLSETEKPKESSIYLFGGFQAFDKERNDITALFTPTLKQLFVVVLLSGIKNRKGISSIKLTDLLWPNKSESKARNNRNVNISKLRLILEKIGDIDIKNENAYWRINVGDSVYCDYSFVKNLLNNSQDSSQNLDKEDIYKLLKIVSNGEISPDIHAEWIEEYKEDINNLLIDDLTRISKTQDDLHLLVLIANTILKYGPLDEGAISLKCKSLYAMGKKGEAKRAYNTFCKEYQDVLDTNYEKSFKSIIS